MCNCMQGTPIGMYASVHTLISKSSDRSETACLSQPDPLVRNGHQHVTQILRAKAEPNSLVTLTAEAKSDDSLCHQPALGHCSLAWSKISSAVCPS